MIRLEGRAWMNGCFLSAAFWTMGFLEDLMLCAWCFCDLTHRLESQAVAGRFEWRLERELGRQKTGTWLLCLEK